MGNNNDKKDYFNELLELNPYLKFQFKIIKKIKTYENVLDCNYIKRYNRILNKYKNSCDYDLRNMIRLFLQMDKILKMDSMIPLTSYDNKILNFENEFAKNKILEKSFNGYVDSCIENMKEGIEKNITLPRIICKDLIKQIEKTKYTKLLKFLREIYYKKCRKNIGLCHLKNGREYYKLLIKYFCNGAYMSPQKIHNYGKKLVKKFIKKIDKNYYKYDVDILQDVKKYNNEILTEIIPNNFHYVPLKNMCKFKKVPKNLENTSAYAYFEPEAKTFFLNYKYDKEINKNSLKCLLMHEVNPGHSYYFNYFTEYKKLPLHKIYAIDNTALEEGWAIYAEKLGNLKYDEYGEYEQLRCVRLVVDTGINYYGWSFNKALNYMKKHLTSLSIDEIYNEITRYICDPGQALAYKIGERFILKLRRLYIKKYKLGDIKDFHDFLLEDGNVSFKYLMHKLKSNRIIEINH